MNRNVVFGSQFVRYAGNQTRNKTHYRHVDNGWDVVSTSLHTKWDNATHPAEHDDFKKRSDLDIDRWVPKEPMMWNDFAREVREATYEFDEIGYHRFVYALAENPDFHHQGANPDQDGPDIRNAREVYEFLTSKFSARILKDSGERMYGSVPRPGKDHYGSLWEGNWNGPQDQNLGMSVSNYVRDGRGSYTKCDNCEGTGQIWSEEESAREQCVNPDHKQALRTECIEIPISQMDKKMAELEDEYDDVEGCSLDDSEPGIIKRRMMTCVDEVHRDTCPECRGDGRHLEKYFHRSFGPIMESEASTRQLQVIQLAIDWMIRGDDGSAPDPVAVLELFETVEEDDQEALFEHVLDHLKPLLADRENERIVVHPADSDEFASDKAVAEVKSEPTQEALEAGAAKIEAALTGQSEDEVSGDIATV